MNPAEELKSESLVNAPTQVSPTEAAVSSIAKRLSHLESELQGHRNEVRNIIIGTFVALILIVTTVAIEVIIFHVIK